MSDSLFLLTTSFPSRSENYEIKTGGWRPLNLEITPFNFGLPFLSLNEGCTEGKGTFTTGAAGRHTPKPADRIHSPLPAVEEVASGPSAVGVAFWEQPFLKLPMCRCIVADMSLTRF